MRDIHHLEDMIKGGSLMTISGSSFRREEVVPYDKVKLKDPIQEQDNQDIKEKKEMIEIGVKPNMS